MTLGRRSLPPIDKEVMTSTLHLFEKVFQFCKSSSVEKLILFSFQAIQAKTGFLDIDRIDSTLWPLLSDDLDSGENSIITSAFGNHLTLIFFSQKT